MAGAGGASIRAVYARARRRGGMVSTVDDLLSFAEFAMDNAASLLATGGAVASSQLGSVYGLGWNLDRGGRVRWHGGDWGGCHATPADPAAPPTLLVVPSRRVAVVVVTTDDAGVDLRRDFAWAELTRLTGLRRARLVPAARTAVATLRGAVASVVAAAAPRTLSS